MQPSFGSYYGDHGAELLCPKCGFNFLHHDKVEVFECDEDADQGIHVIVSNREALINTSLTGNPSSRRQGLKIYFWCEGCSTKSIFSVSQDKGVTLVKFNHAE